MLLTRGISMEITVWVLVFYYLCETLDFPTYYYIYHEKPPVLLICGSDVEGLSCPSGSGCDLRNFQKLKHESWDACGWSSRTQGWGKSTPSSLPNHRGQGEAGVTQKFQHSWPLAQDWGKGENGDNTSWCEPFLISSSIWPHGPKRYHIFKELGDGISALRIAFWNFPHSCLHFIAAEVCFNKQTSFSWRANFPDEPESFRVL